MKTKLLLLLTIISFPIWASFPVNSCLIDFEPKENIIHISEEHNTTDSQITKLFLAFFITGICIHRFLMGYRWESIAQLVTAGGLGIWATIDLIRIISGDLKSKNAVA